MRRATTTMMMTHLRQLGLFFGKDNFNLNMALLLMIYLLFFNEHLLLGLFLSSSSTFWSTFLFPHLYTWMIFRKPWWKYFYQRVYISA